MGVHVHVHVAVLREYKLKEEAGLVERVQQRTRTEAVDTCSYVCGIETEAGIKI